MNIILKCGKCSSTMDLAFKPIADRSSRTNTLEITCQSCKANLNAGFVRQLVNLIEDYRDYAPDWEFEFKLTPPEPKGPQI